MAIVLLFSQICSAMSLFHHVLTDVLRREWHSCSHRFSRGMKLVVRIHRHITLPRCHRKMAARTDFTSKYGLPYSSPRGKIFWQRLSVKLHFLQRIMASVSFKLCQSRSKSGKVI